MRRTDRLLRALRPVAPWAVAGLSLLVSHDLIWAFQVGPGEALATALRSAGHGYWGAASLLLSVAGLLVALGAILRLARLWRRAVATGHRSKPQHARRVPGYGRRALGAWLRLLAIVAIGFALQENVEHVVAHGHLPMLGALVGPEYPLALPVIATITGFGALLIAAVASVERNLVARIVAALSTSAGRAPARIGRPRSITPRRRSLLAGANAGRAPPHPAAA